MLKKDLPKIQPSGSLMWDIYRISRVFTEYRGFKLHDKPIDQKDFEKKINNYGFISFNGEHNSTQYIITIVNNDDKLLQSVDEIKYFINKITESKKSNICIVNDVTALKKYIDYYKKPNFTIYPHQLFKVVVPLGPYCSDYEIMSEEETENVLQYLNISKSLLKQISVNDPQMVWLGVPLGKVVRVINRSTLCGYSVDYRVVI